MYEYKALRPCPDAEDAEQHARRCDAESLTRRTREMVPFADFVGGRVRHVSEHYAEAEIPLLPGPMNQNGIHLASNHYFLADWVVALGVFGALPGVTVQGFHDPSRSTVTQIWTTRAEIEHLAPGTGTIRCRWSLAPEHRETLRQELVETGRGTLHTVAEVEQDGRVVARVVIDQVVFAFTPHAPGEPPTLIQSHRGHLSALLVAGLRTDPVSQSLAGEQGRALAARMSLPLPQLPRLVQARTAHLDAWLARLAPGQQVLTLGLGLDARALRFAQHRWFGVDLLPTLKRRARHFARASCADPVRAVAGDLRDDAWHAALGAVGFDRGLPTAVLLEGVSMYLEPGVVTKLLRSLAAWLGGGALWMDFVSPALLESAEGGARAFLDDLARLGEPFIHGLDDLDALGTPWRTQAQASAADHGADDDALGRGYRFAVATCGESP